MDVKARYEAWLKSDVFDASVKEELAAIAGDEKEIKERFYGDLSFGTGGMRGIIGAGTNRINRYTIRRATQGLANYILKQELAEKGVAIAFDSRRMSPEFAQEAALCLCANGIPVHIFESLRPTPELSFALRELGCVAGINITASHNPPEYNGYKVYWSDGAQVTPPHDTGIMAQVEAVTDYANAKTMSPAEAERAGLYHVIGKEMDDRYMEALKKQVKRPEVIAAAGKDLAIVYTPLHGTGNLPVRRILSELGFENVHVVSEQELPDGNFPTVSYPNPEAAEAFCLALALAAKVDADLVLATDPDADRLGVYVKDTVTGEYHSLTGNMSGCLLADYEIGSLKQAEGLPKEGALISTIVSSNMAGAVARKYGVDFIEVLTGFKYIGEVIRDFEQSGKGRYLFGFEESYGCLIGTHARDKDAVVASMALCEAAAYYKQKDMTLWDAMLALYEELGYYKDDIISITLKGLDGLDRMAQIMQSLRENPPRRLGCYEVEAVRDYKSGIRVDAAGKRDKLTLPPSNVLYYELSEDAWCCVRPSGTEPKIKLYFGVKGTSFADADVRAAQLGEALHEIVSAI